MLKILKSEFTKNVAALITGTTIAQLISILLTPIIARLYTPEEFGFYGFYLSLVGVLTVIASGRYHLALFIVKHRSKAVYILKSTILVTFFMAIVISLMLLLFRFFYGYFSPWFYILGVIVLNAALIEVFSIYANTKGQYKLMSANMIIRSIVANLIFILLGFLQYGRVGLMLGIILGQFSQLFHFYMYIKSDIQINKLNYKVFKATLFTYKNFLIHSTSSALLNNLSIQLPTFFLKKYYNTASVGQYFQSYKLLTLPNSFIAKSFGSVFAQKVADSLKQKLPIDKMVISLYQKLIFVSVIPFSLLAIYGDKIMVFVLGEQWQLAGSFAQIISPWIYINFIVLPFTYLFEIYQKQKHFSIFNLVLLVTRFIALIIGYLYKDVYLSVMLFSITSFFIYGAMLFYLFRLTKVKGFINYIMYVVLFISGVLIVSLFRLW